MPIGDRSKSKESKDRGGKGSKDKDKDTFKRSFGRTRKHREPPYPLDYKNKFSLLPFLTEQGKIIPRRVSGLNAKQQRGLAVAIKRSRHLSLIPYTSRQIPSKLPQSFGA